MDLRVAECVATVDNPRTINEADPKFLELVDSVKRNGVLVDVAARPITDVLREVLAGHARDMAKGAKYEVLYGERRLRAARLAGLETIPAIVHEGLTDEQAFELTFGENFNREDLKPLEEAKAVSILLRKCGGNVLKVCEKMGKSERAVRRRMRLIALSDGWVKAIEDPASPPGRAGLEHLEVIARLPRETQDQLLKKATDGRLLEEWGGDPRSVQSLEKEIGRLLHVIGSVAWAKSCEGCPRRSDAEDMAPLCGAAGNGKKPEKGAKATCLDPECWLAKHREYIQEREKALKKEHGKKLLRITNAEYGDRTELSSKALKSCDYVKAKKGDKGAEPALVVEGSGFGSVEFVKRLRTAGSSTPKPKEPSLQEKKKRLGRKRWAWVVDQLRAKLKKMSCPFQQDQLMALAAVFGCRNGTYWGARDPKRWTVWKRVYPLTKKSRQLCIEDLWTGVRKELVERLHHWGAAEALDASVITEANKQAELLKVDLKPWHEQAAKKFPEPPAWTKKTMKKKTEPGKGKAKK